MAIAITPAAIGVNHDFGIVARLRKAVTDYALYRRTLAELNALSDRELRDLGMSRFVIKQIAHTSVYGA